MNSISLEKETRQSDISSKEQIKEFLQGKTKL